MNEAPVAPSERSRLIRWLKEIGDHVEKDEPIMEIETDKITMEAEAPATGILLAKLIDDWAAAGGCRRSMRRTWHDPSHARLRYP